MPNALFGFTESLSKTLGDNHETQTTRSPDCAYCLARSHKPLLPNQAVFDVPQAMTTNTLKARSNVQRWLKPTPIQMAMILAMLQPRSAA